MMDVLTAIVPLVLGQCQGRPISVTQYPQPFFVGTPLQEDCFDDAPQGGGTFVPINLNINTRSVKITSSAGTQRIPRIDFVSPQYSVPTIVQVALGSVFHESDQLPTPIAASEWFGGMKKQTNLPWSERLELHLYGGVTGGLKEEVRVGLIYRLDFGKEIKGIIESAAAPAAAPSDGITVVGRSLDTTGSSIILRHGNSSSCNSWDIARLQDRSLWPARFVPITAKSTK